MPWARLDDGLNDDAKLNALSAPAFRLWVRGLVWCQKNLSDGFIPEREIPRLTAETRERDRPKLIAELCATLVPGKGALWVQVDGGYQMHDFLEWNDSRDKVLAERELAKKRLERFQGKRGLKRVVNAVVNAFVTPHGTGSKTSSERCTTYHVPEEQKQEHAPSAKTSLEFVDVRMLRRERSRETSDGKPAVKVITALARHLIASHPELDEGELMEAVKRQCAKSNLEYAGVVGAAIDRARAQLARKAAS